MQASDTYPVFNPLRHRGTPVPCMPIDENRMIIQVSLDQMEKFVVDPLLTEDPKMRERDVRARTAWDLRSKAQRAVADQAAKRRNIPNYAAYLTAGMVKGQPYVTPPQSLVVLEKVPILRSSDSPDAQLVAVIPDGVRAFHEDGETQYLARQAARNDHPETAALPFAVVVDHGRDLEWASQAFHDLNMLGVPMTAATAIAADNRDAATALAKELAEEVDALRGRVSFNSRQVTGGSGDSLMTITTLRRMVVAALVGRKVFQLSNSPFGEAITTEQRTQVKAGINRIFTELRVHLNRDTVFALPVVVTAIGILLHDTLTAERNESVSTDEAVGKLIDDLAEVRWSKAGDDGALRWAGIAGKLTDKGAFSAGGGVKDLGYRLLTALTDPKSDIYLQIRE